MDFNFIHKSIAYSPKRFFNRELSLLKFHERVLAESFRNSLPLLERLRFLSIAGSNLDEFCMVRFAALKEKRLDEENVSIDGQSFKQQIKNAYPYIESIKEKQYTSFVEIKRQLEQNGYFFAKISDLRKKEINKLEKEFMNEILPNLKIQAVDDKFPFLPNLSLNLLVVADDIRYVISLPRRCQRFIPIIKNKTKVAYIAVEDVVSLFSDKIFKDVDVRVCAFFSVIRDTLMAFDEKAEDVIGWFEEALAKRKQGRITLVDIRLDATNDDINYLKKKMKLDDADITVSKFLAYRHLGQVVFPFKKKMLFREYSPRKSEQIKKFDGDYFKAIDSEDILIHHPYESYEIVVNFLKQAAKDKDVISIKQTIYRTNKESPIMKALIEGAKNGKDVTAFIELRARFDEEANLAWAKAMEIQGVKVVFGHKKYKCHSKISLVQRKHKDEIKSYVHYGTGNYNPITANIYTDLSFFTCDRDLGEDADEVFNVVETSKRSDRFKKLVIAPYYLRDRLVEHIEKEIEFAKLGKPASIWAKANSLMDDVVIDALYRASQAGVKIKLIIRGICALRPGVKGLSENITVKSIVGRFLEHSRIYCFGNGRKMAPENAVVYISSADLMRRNMVKRVETLIPIDNSKIKKQILNQIMYANIKDVSGSWVLDEDMNYNRQSDDKGFSAQEFFMRNPSLSSAGAKSKLRRKVKNTK